jgi:hypothetical protein
LASFLPLDKQPRNKQKKRSDVGKVRKLKTRIFLFCIDNA